MQGMSGLATEPASSPPRTLLSDVTAEKSVTDSSKPNNKTKETPKIQENVSKLDTKSVTNDESDVSVAEKTDTTSSPVSSKVLETRLAFAKRSPSHNSDNRFSCKMCDLSFSSNAGLHRHMRTHKASQQDSDSEDSDGGVPNSPSRSRSSKRRLEYNNNEKSVNGCGGSSADDEMGPPTKKRSKTINDVLPQSQNIGCPACERRDFDSLPSLEAHIEAVHPDYHVKFALSNLSFKNNGILNLHKGMVHRSDRKPLSSEVNHFAKIRRDSSSAEEDARRDDFFANLNLQNKSPGYTPALRPSSDSAKLIARDCFPMGKDALRPFIDTTKDLADIHSILSVASSGGIFEQLNQKSREISRGHEQMTPKLNEESEEAQDAFAVEFRKMKLRGEFPCRLCTAIFPNLRALKGHNRVHLSGNGPGPYKCNMCPHSSLDKAALVRHMRTHNGDRPYECSVCNYAFTTKANCERHLRNRHSKVTREEVKRSIIYHPSEDPNNDEVNNKLNISKDDIKRSSLMYTSPDNDRHEERSERHTPVTHFIRESLPTFNDHKIPLPLPLQRDLSLVIPQPRIVQTQRSLENIHPKLPITPEEIIQARLQQGKTFGQLTQIPEFNESDGERDNETDNEETLPTEETYTKPLNYVGESPMDLSTGEFQDDALDLSKKKGSPENAPAPPSPVIENETFSAKSPEFNNNQAAAATMFEKTQQLLMAQQQLLKGVQLQKMDPAANFYANLYRAGAAFQGLGLPPGFPLHPYLLQPHLFLGPTSNAKELAEIKEKIQKDIIMRFQMSGGSLVGMDHNTIANNLSLDSDRVQGFHQQALNNVANHDSKSSTPVPVIKSEDDSKPVLPISLESQTSSAAFHNPLPSPKISKKDPPNKRPNSVKMVIKNGVLMPKQKQRRYRTERPFSCEHCSARFTLRSNMERHIKQQHPQYWSQRQRSNIGIPRKSPISMVPQNVTVPSLSYENRLNYLKNLNDGSNEEEKCSMISDQVRYAILAQKLKTQSSFAQDKPNTSLSIDNDEEDEEDALVIDEEEEDEDVEEVRAKSPQQEDKDENNSLAKKVAEQILIGVATKTQSDINKDFDWKITGNLISKNPSTSIIPKFVSEIAQNEKTEKTGETKQEEGDLVSVSRLLNNAANQIPFGNFFKNEYLPNQRPNCDIASSQQGDGSEEDEEGLVASSGSTSEGNNSGSDENRSESENTTQAPQKKKSAYSLAPNRVSCQYCHRKFPWFSSLRRHVLTHTGQKPFKCPHCPLLFTTKSNCDRHLLRKHGSHSLPSQQNTSHAIETSPTNTSIAGLANQGLMRNVPERPYKCANCPSSTFSTLGNLKKHMSSKHGIIIPDSSPDSPKNDDGPQRPESADHNLQSGSDDEKSSCNNDSEKREAVRNESCEDKNDWEGQISSKYSPSFSQETPSNMQNTDLPFKCHLCDHSFSERHEALDHIKDLHASEYELLMSKGALETSVGFADELGSSTPGHKSEGGEDQGLDDSGEQQRGKFPHYINRKVMCAFCMRRFWSAEDLRRHMRTHSGERPFECEYCRRRFTLKHSMLRHLKKHRHASSGEEMDLSTASGDEENTSTMSQNYSSSSGVSGSPIDSSYQAIPNSSTPNSSKNPLLTLSGYQMAIHKNLSPDIPNNVNNNNSPPAQNYEGKMKVKNVNMEKYKRNRYSSDDNDIQDCEMESGNDLIGNLLGISDEGMINKLFSSPDEAAKLLGVGE